MAQEAKGPYWLVREPGKAHGIGTVQLDEAITSAKALEVFRARPEVAMLITATHPLEAVLVTLRYEAGQPVVEEVR